jgi:hypothetical protein
VGFFQGEDHLGDIEPGHGFREGVTLDEEVEKVAAAHIFQQQ